MSFSIPSSQRNTTEDLFIIEIIIQGLDNGVKLQNFLGQNSPLTNGIDFSFKSDDEASTFPTVFSTRDIKRFSTAGGWYLDVESAADDAMAIKELGILSIPIRAISTFPTDDDFTVTLNDNILNVASFKVVIIGFRRPA